MPLIVTFVTSHDAVLDTVTERRVSLIPQEMRAKGLAALGGEEVVVSAYRVTHQSNFDGLLKHLKLVGVATASGVVILTDGALPNLIDHFGDLFSINQFHVPAQGRDPANILSSTLAKCLRTFRHYKNRFDDLKYQQLLRLPLRNFKAAEIESMRLVCHDMMNSENFAQQLDGLLKLLRLRQHPKKASTHKDIYLVDDKEKHFRYGLEVHARAETSIPPHNCTCILANGFRFGRSFDGTRHFNVSHDGEARMTALYEDCHGNTRSGRGATHLNMFTNDFF